jgi:hypothetical protein
MCYFGVSTNDGVTKWTLNHCHARFEAKGRHCADRFAERLLIDIQDLSILALINIIPR